MNYDYETFATAAMTRLQNDIYVCVSALMTELIKNAEHHSDYSDDLYDITSVEEVAEGQRRIHQPVVNGVIRVVEVATSDQDDEDVTEYSEVLFSTFAGWLWNQMTESAQSSWRDRANVTNFNPNLEEHQDMLFCVMDAHPGTASGLLPYLKQQENWPHHWALLDEGDDPEMTDHEVFEHWAVSDYAQRQLQSVGEKVVEVMGLNVWCRTTTGQIFWYDGCMQQLGKQYANT